MGERKREEGGRKRKGKKTKRNYLESSLQGVYVRNTERERERERLKRECVREREGLKESEKEREKA